MQPRVAIVTPSYNQGHFIRATIESVLSQDYPNIEYIIMDGGSTDETAAVVREYSSRLTFISEKDRGQSDAINKGFRMASSPVLAWLNSDDIYLPGAISAAVAAFQSNPAAGAIYGEGYLIDRDGNITSRFPHTEPFNLWKLTHLSDYILQQSVFFRKDVLEDVGYINESLHYAMDWDILIRIGKKYPLVYIPQEMGCLREYAEAKSFAGGARRATEIGRVLRGHTGQSIPPGHVIYGLDTWHPIICSKIDRVFPGPLSPTGNFLKRGVRGVAGLIISRTIAESQGLYPDGWAAKHLHYMLPPGAGNLILDGELPDWTGLYGQRLYIYEHDRLLAARDIESGEFQLVAPLPRDLEGTTLQLTVRSLLSFVPQRFTPGGDRRNLAFRFKGLRLAA